MTSSTKAATTTTTTTSTTTSIVTIAMETNKRIRKEIEQELFDRYENTKLDIEEQTNFELALLKNDLIDEENKALVRQISSKMKAKCKEIYQLNVSQLNAEFARVNKESREWRGKDDVKIKDSCIFVSNHILLKELRKKYPVGVLVVTNYYLHPFQQAFIRNHFVVDDEMNWDRLTLNLLNMDLFDYQYRVKHLGYIRDGLFHVYKRATIEQLITSSFIQSKHSDRANFYFFE